MLAAGDGANDHAGRSDEDEDDVTGKRGGDITMSLMSRAGGTVERKAAARVSGDGASTKDGWRVERGRRRGETEVGTGWTGRNGDMGRG